MTEGTRIVSLKIASEKKILLDVTSFKDVPNQSFVCRHHKHWHLDIFYKTFFFYFSFLRIRFFISSVGVVLRQEDDKKDEEENDDAKYFDHQPTIGSYTPEENQDKGLLRNDVTERNRKTRILCYFVGKFGLSHFKLNSQI